MHRFTSTSPRSSYNLGLLLLRVALGVTLAIQGSAYLPELQRIKFGSWAMCLLMLGTGGSLLIGFFTRTVSALALLSSIGMTLSWFPVPALNLFSSHILSMNLIALALATSLLGPGAFSLDTRLFGLRKVIIPRAISES